MSNVLKGRLLCLSLTPVGQGLPYPDGIKHIGTGKTNGHFSIEVFSHQKCY